MVEADCLGAMMAKERRAKGLMRDKHKRTSRGSRWRHSGMASARYPPAAIYRLFGLIIPDAASHTPCHSCRWRFWGILRIHRTPFVISPESRFPIFMETYKHQYADFMTQTRAFWYLFDYFYISKELHRNDIYQENMLILYFQERKDVNLHVFINFVVKFLQKTQTRFTNGMNNGNKQAKKKASRILKRE